jgi:phosphopantetheine--protein transferase-like protein
MDEIRASEYLSKLLNRDVQAHTAIVLSSGQRARFLSWLEHAGALSDEVRSAASRQFNVHELLNAEGSSSRSAPVARRVMEPSGPAAVIAGVGIDIQRIAEIIPYDDAFDFRTAAELAAIFSQREISYACARSSPVQTLAGLFAAKEAIIKADPSKTTTDLHQLEILPDGSGSPAHPGFQLSISHSGEYAVAMALRVANISAPQPARETSASATQPANEPSALPKGAATRPATSTRKTLLALILLAAGILCIRYAWLMVHGS